MGRMCMGLRVQYLKNANIQQQILEYITIKIADRCEILNQIHQLFVIQSFINNLC